MTPPLTDKEVAALALVRAFSDVIRALGEVPSGHLYERVMSKMTLEQYDLVIDVMLHAKLIERKNHLLKWIGPKETKDEVGK